MWVLVFWIVHPHHAQAVRIERGFTSESACVFHADQLRASTREDLHYHCGKE
jgi:hypothetical protein